MDSAEARRRAKLWAAGYTDDALRRMALGIRLPDEISFIRSLQIEDKVSGGLIDFDLWDFQEELVADLRANDWTFVLKARQLGITWVIEAHLLYLATFWGNRLFLIFSQTGEDASAALARIRTMIASMPAKWRPKLIKDNTREIDLANGSRFHSMMATKRAGRSHAPYAVLADEIDFWSYPNEQMATIEATAPRIYAVTTGNGPDGRAPVMWRKALAGEGRYLATFLPWDVHPDRNATWYQVNVEEAPEPRLAHREFAATPEEAFASPEGVFFERWDAKVNSPGAIAAVHNWQTWRCADFGFHWPAALWVQISPKGQFFVVAELARREPFNWTTEEFADEIIKIDNSLGLFEPPRGTFCDPAGRGVEAQTGESEIDVFKLKGLAPISEPSSIRDGCVRIMDAIADPDLPLLVSRSCTWTAEALGRISPDKHRPDVYDEKSSYTHVLDALRYFMVNQAVGQQEWPDINYGDGLGPLSQFL